MAQDKKLHTILLIDDDHFLLNMYSIKFKASGFEVTVVTGAEEALSKFNEGYKPDVVMLDVVMPGMDGIDLLEKIRKDKLIPQAKIIMLTNQSQSHDIEKAKSLNVAGYIVKATTIPSEVVAETIRIIGN